MSPDDRTIRPPQAGLPEEGADVGGIPSTLNQGVDHASDRAGGRREGTPESDAGGGQPPSLPVSRGSAAVAPRPAHDKTGSAATSETSAGPGAATDASPRDGAGRGDADHSGQDDSVPESLGKAITEPFKSD
jgi:hypothetical protein